MEDYLFRLFWYIMIATTIGYTVGFFCGRASK